MGAALGMVLLGVAGGGCTPDPCQECAANETPYVCTCDGVDRVVCGVDDVQAAFKCEGNDPATSSCTLGKKISCDGPPPTGTDTDGGQSQWNPGAWVYFDGSVYQVDSGFIDGLKADPNQLLWDSARIDAVPGGGFQFRGVAPADLAAQLGFQDGDQPLRVEVGRARYPLGTFDEFVTALDAVYDETDLSVVFQRGRQTLRNRYRIVSP